MELRSNQHSIFRLNYHLVMCVKYRRKVLDDILALANVQLNLKKTYDAFFRKNAKFPKFKSKKDTRQSYTTNNQNGTVRIDGNTIKLPKIGFVKFIQHRQLKANEKIKSCTISKAPSGKYYVSILVEGFSQIEQVKPTEDNVLGLDYAMNCFYVVVTVR